MDQGSALGSSAMAAPRPPPSAPRGGASPRGEGAERRRCGVPAVPEPRPSPSPLLLRLLLSRRYRRPNSGRRHLLHLPMPGAPNVTRARPARHGGAPPAAILSVAWRLPARRQKATTLRFSRLSPPASGDGPVREDSKAKDGGGAPKERAGMPHTRWRLPPLSPPSGTRRERVLV